MTILYRHHSIFLIHCGHNMVDDVSMNFRSVQCWCCKHEYPWQYDIFMRPSSLGGGRILRRTLSVRLSVRPSRYRCHR